MYFNSSFTNKDQRRKSALLKGYFGSFMQNYQLLVEDMSYMCIFISWKWQMQSKTWKTALIYKDHIQHNIYV